MEDFDGLGIGLAAVSVDPPEELAKLRARVGASFPFLQDRDAALLDTLELRDVGGGWPMEDADIARPALTLLDGEGQVIWMYVSDNYRVRPEPELVLRSSRRALLKEGLLDTGEDPGS